MTTETAKDAITRALGRDIYTEIEWTLNGYVGKVDGEFVYHITFSPVGKRCWRLRYHETVIATMDDAPSSVVLPALRKRATEHAAGVTP